MTDTKDDQKLAMTYALLSKAAARRKIYAHKAAQEGYPEVALFLRAMAASEAVQARRLFNSLIGRVDKSEKYLATIFNHEVQEILDSYSELLDHVSELRPALLHAISQLRAAETRLQAFYAVEDDNVKAERDAKYFVCKFCGYIGTNTVPDRCPICTAPKEAFHKVA